MNPPATLTRSPQPADLALEQRREGLLRQYREVRSFTEKLCEPLAVEDYVIQTMPDVSPTKWHLAHTTWFFETFLLKEFAPGFEPYHPMFNYLFNSYYNAVGVMHCRPKRGQISRPTVKEVFDFRANVDERMAALLHEADETKLAQLKPLVELGCHHEQQHQELMLTDLKHVYSSNPLFPVYTEAPPPEGQPAPALEWIEFEGGIHRIGHEGEDFCYDNETPAHDALLQDFRLGSRLVTCGEWIEFIEAGGYKTHSLWLSLGWATVQDQEWTAPFYWDWRDGEWWLMTLNGFRRVDPAEPVSHVSFFEADAFARWSGARLPTEFEWEVAARTVPVEGNFVDQGRCHPIPASQPAPGEPALQQMFGDLWEWTASPYVGYPGYKPAPGAIGEYNGKFMSNQMTVRGGSCATSLSHIRPTYRSFFEPHQRWQFLGLRLAKDA